METVIINICELKELYAQHGCSSIEERTYCDGVKVVIGVALERLWGEGGADKYTVLLSSYFEGTGLSRTV